MAKLQCNRGVLSPYHEAIGVRHPAHGGRNIFRTALAFALLISLPAFAQPPQCAKRSAILKTLSTKYGEVPIGIGLTANGSVLELVASGTGSWSVIVTDTTGTTCPVAVGEAWSAGRSGDSVESGS